MAKKLAKNLVFAAIHNRIPRIRSDRPTAVNNTTNSIEMTNVSVTNEPNVVIDIND